MVPHIQVGLPGRIGVDHADALEPAGGADDDFGCSIAVHIRLHGDAASGQAAGNADDLGTAHARGDHGQVDNAAATAPDRVDGAGIGAAFIVVGGADHQIDDAVVVDVASARDGQCAQVAGMFGDDLVAAAAQGGEVDLGRGRFAEHDIGGVFAGRADQNIAQPVGVDVAQPGDDPSGQCAGGCSGDPKPASASGDRVQIDSGRRGFAEDDIDRAGIDPPASLPDAPTTISANPSPFMSATLASALPASSPAACPVIRNPPVPAATLLRLTAAAEDLPNTT